MNLKVKVKSVRVGPHHQKVLSTASCVELPFQNIICEPAVVSFSSCAFRGMCCVQRESASFEKSSVHVGDEVLVERTKLSVNH